MKLRTSRRQSNRWFYGLLLVFILIGYVVLQFAIFGSSSCSGQRQWAWKFPPGFVCAAPSF
jgi:hypothetical protein